MACSEELQPEFLLQAYAMGIFPMADHRGELGWYAPDPRAVIELDHFKISRSLRQRVRKARPEIRFNACFERVIHCCADRDEGTWISPEIIDAYVRLYRLGFAHSVETYYGDELALMFDSGWKNPYVTNMKAKGYYHFWPLYDKKKMGKGPKVPFKITVKHPNCIEKTEEVKLELLSEANLAKSNVMPIVLLEAKDKDNLDFLYNKDK